jgi:hypothetical protein
MAARTKVPSKIQQDQTRAAIKTTQLVKRLQAFALGESEVVAAEGEDPKPVEIDALRLKAIEVLLRKSLPDLSAVQLSGDAENPIAIEEVGQASAKVLAMLNTIAERSGTTGEPSAE